MLVQRTDNILRPDPTRVLIRYFSPGSRDRIERIIARVMCLDKRKLPQRLKTVCRHFESRHKDIEAAFLRHYQVVAPYLLTDAIPSLDQQLLIGAYFTSEYSLECAALFNPSIVPHPDQSGTDEGVLRFIMSLRATGEGHVSSIVFREGTIDAAGTICMESPGDVVTDPELVQNPSYDKAVFGAKLYEMGYDNDITADVLKNLAEVFTLADLKEQIAHAETAIMRFGADRVDTLQVMRILAEQNYEIKFAGTRPVSERVIFPRISHNRKAIEDARFVKFHNPDGSAVYYATYTAYDGRTFLPQLLQTENFLDFRFITLNGSGVMNKGMALFPRKINGQYAMLSRQDGENIFIMFSGHLHFWENPSIIMKPTASWEYVQLGNCGSPIETPEGWLVLTHGVGPMRRYCIGAVLLDLDDPAKVIGRLKEPLLEPDENERDGYVPNVVYTCGALVHGRKLVMPYAMADYATRIALVDLDELLAKLKE